MSSQWEINVNTLFKYKVDKNDVIERVLYIYPDRSRVFTISLSEKKPFPVLRKFSEIKEGLENGAYSTDVVDPYAILMNPSSEYLKKYGDDLEEKWNLIKDLVENEPAAYDRAFRGEFIADLISRSKKSKSLIYKYLRYYWTGGKIKYALLPHYFKCPESVTNLSPLRQRGQYMEKSNRKSPHQLKIRDENKSTNDRIHQARHAQ